jgi:hypothetical protein
LAELSKAISPAEFYQLIASELIKGIYAKKSLGELANNLITLADHAYTIRQMSAVDQASQIILALPVSGEYKSAAHYYHGLYIKRQGLISEARVLFERAAEHSPLRYRAKALQSLGAIFYEGGDYKSALPLCLEACRIATRTKELDPIITIHAQHLIAGLKSLDGDHRGSVAYIENLLPLVYAVRSSYPALYFNILNSLAVELGEVGRLEEAGNISNLVLASPYVIAYPEWRETGDDIERKGYRSPRSFVPLNHRLLNIKNVVLYLSMPEPSDTTNSEKYHRNPFQQGSITILQDWKRKMVKESNDKQNDKDDLKDATEKDLYLKLMELMAKRDLSTKQLRRVIDFVERISSEPDSDPKDD